MEKINNTSQNHIKHDENSKNDTEIGFPTHKSSSDLILRNNNNKIHNSEGLPSIDHENDDFYTGEGPETQNSSSPSRLTKSNSLSSIIPPKFQNLSDLSRQQQQQHPGGAEPKSLPAPNKFTAFFAKFAKKNNNNNNNNNDSSSSQVVSSAKYQTNTPQFIPKKKKTTNTITTSEDRKRETRESRMIACAKIWKESDVISNWNKRKLSKKTRELIWWGVPPNVRSHVWPLFIGNKLSLTRELFDIYMMQAGRTKTRSSENNIGKESTVHLIPIDLPRTFPHLSFFHPEGPLYSQLRDVLEAYACYRPDIGYVQGMSYLASMFLLYMDPLSSFICLANILNRPLLMGFYRMEHAQINNFIKTLNLMLEIYLPNLYKHFSSMQITPEVYIMDWVMTLFSKSFELDVVSRIWDTLLFEGEFFIIKVGIGLLKVSESILLANNYEECLIYLTHLPSIEEDALFDAISSFDFRACKVVDDYLSFLSTQSSTY